jgi:DHA2 family multidrug resistance protein
VTDAVIEDRPSDSREGREADASPTAAEHLNALGIEGEINWTKIFLGFGGMVVGQFMAFLDIQIVTSSLTQIQNGVGATPDEISWVQTIYLLAEVVIMPLTAYMTRLWGTRPFFMVAAVGFVIASIGTGLSSSIEMMIFTRALQGVAAGAMIPPVFAMAMTLFPPKQRITANIIMSLIMTLAPTVGPTLGGHITEWMGWRWLFFINVPPGLLVLFLVGRYGGFDKGDPTLARKVDWIGVGTMTIFLLSAQYVFEEGAGKWFADDKILWLTVTAVIAGVTFIWRTLTIEHPILSFKPFTDRNFALGLSLNVLNSVALFGGSFVMPLFLSQVLGYSSAQVGATMLVSGLVMFVGAPIAGRLIDRIDARLAIIAGMSITAYGTYLGVQMNPNWGFAEFALFQFIRSAGMIVATIGMMQMTFVTLPVAMMKDASSLLNVIRNVGGAIGLAICSSVMTSHTAAHYNELTSLVNSASWASQDLMNGLSAMMQESGTPDPEGAGRKAFSLMLHRQAVTLGFNDAFGFLTASSALAMVFAIFMVGARRSVRPVKQTGAH